MKTRNKDSRHIPGGSSCYMPVQSQVQGKQIPHSSPEGSSAGVVSTKVHMIMIASTSTQMFLHRADLSTDAAACCEGNAAPKLYYLGRP